MLSATLMMLLAAEPLPGLAVMDFATEGAAPEIGTATSGLVAHELERLQLFRVTSAETTRVILGVERQRQLLGCESCSATTLSSLTSFEYLVTGKLTRTGPAKEPTYNLLMTLLKTGDNAPLSSVRLEAKGEERLLQEVPSTTLKLIGKILEGRQGSLVVSSSESGRKASVSAAQAGRASSSSVRARQTRAIGAPVLQPTRYSSRSRNVGSAQWTSSNTTSSGSSRATRSSSLRAAQKTSPLSTAPEPESASSSREAARSPSGSSARRTRGRGGTRRPARRSVSPRGACSRSSPASC